MGVLILAGIGAVNGRSLVPTLHAWDGNWYLRIAATGYSALSAGVDANGHVAVEHHDGLLSRLFRADHGAAFADPAPAGRRPAC